MQSNQTKQPIEMHKKYKTRDGRPVRILCTDRKFNLPVPVVALFTDEAGYETLVAYSSDGAFTSGCDKHYLDLIEVQPWDDFKIDDPVLVRDCEGDEWYKRYFAGVSDQGKPLAFQDGSTSWSSGGVALKWNYCKKPD